MTEVSGQRDQDNESLNIVMQRLGPEDVDAIRWTMFTAISWNGIDLLPPMDTAVEASDVARYHRNWGRSGDFGVRALIRGQFAGAAFARIFSETDHGIGYVDSATPEVGIGVVSKFRGKGVGRRLMIELAVMAGSAGTRRLSLSVPRQNPARHLYESLGYVKVRIDGDSWVMILDL